ncbi:glycosyltransferase (activator-dependent family) [Actinokineospora baliensis]|uniref:activator-dependent family glycosyltransferase n=1 Tax=Actinokineospora baliensis TaxID=547056 RepID=UPI00195AA24D|nr:activator-dependent family glycosyltransferase [Actinokineospora baliensis]MBM7769822.1 glycosyltransferase (activator-dependent family) [Actinokineospora baliensis]
MRILFVAHSEKTHYFSMVPLASALRTAGHEVRVATQPDMAPAVVESGLVAVPLGSDHKWKQVMQEKGDDSWAARVVDAVTNDVDHDALFTFFDETTRDYFRTVNNEEFVADLVGYARFWQPDLVIWEQFTWAGAVAAEAVGAAHARMLWGADVVTRSRLRFLDGVDHRGDPLADWLTELLTRHGGEFSERVVTGHWTIDPGPPGHRIDNGLDVLPVRYIPYNGPASLPSWLAETPTKPRVAVTAGVSVRGYFGFDMFSLGALHAFADMDIEVIATLLPMPGETADAAPANARVFDFVPMAGLLPTCAAVVHIGGAGIQSTAAVHGVPQLILPGFWDTVVRAGKVVESGAGLSILPHEVTLEHVRDSLARLLEDPAFREGAKRLQEDVLSAPSPNDVVADLERRVADVRA